MEKEIKQLCDQVRETAYAIHTYHGTGHLEKVYENALYKNLFWGKRTLYPLCLKYDPSFFLLRPLRSFVAKNK